jgi:hypothetical protein
LIDSALQSPYSAQSVVQRLVTVIFSSSLDESMLNLRRGLIRRIATARTLLWCRFATTLLLLPCAFKLTLRQAEGWMLSVVELLGCELTVPDHTTVSRRAARLQSITRRPRPRAPCAC